MNLSGKMLVLRADASATNGIGHVSRCVAFAEQWRDAGGQAVLAASGPQAAIAAMAGDLPLEWLGEARPAPDADARRFLEIAAQYGADVALLDSYHHSLAFESQVHARLPLVAMDDLASRAHACDLLVDTSLSAADSARYRGLVPESARLLLGTAYVVLRRLFRMQAFRERGTEPVQRLLLSFGGADPQDHSTLALDSLEAPGLPPLAVDLVLSGTNPRLPGLRQRAAGMPFVQLHVDTAAMAGLMARAGLALGSGGTTSWERCRAGLPALITIVADNQLGVARTLEQAGIVRLVAADGPENLRRAMTAALLRALADADWRASASRAGMALIDGRGGDRLMAQMLPLLRSTS